MDSYFSTNMGYVCSRSLVGDMTLFCDLVVIQALTDQLCNLSLPGR
jgi:TfoX/Sxy family transcriptional regulator of competence genes